MVFEELSGLKEHYLRCVRCGQCRSVCPVFEVVRNETAAPRGKVFLAHMLSSGAQEASREAAYHLSLCLLCQACSKECPSAIPVHQIVAAARSLLAQKIPSPSRRLVFREIWTRPPLLNLAATLVRYGQGLGLVDLGISAGLLPRGVALPGRLPHRPARALLPEITPAGGRARMRVGYFLGCSTNLLFPGVAASTVAVLARLGCEVVLPGELKCCGLPQQASGEGAAAAPLASANLDAFRRRGVEVLVTDCASCAAALMEQTRQEPAGPQVRDLSGLLVDLLKGNHPVQEKIKRAVTYHNPCHQSKASGNSSGPRELLRLICNDFREMRGADICCGGGGTFALSHYDLSMDILSKKISSITETGAAVAATFCPTCTMQLRYGLVQQSSNAIVVHPVQLLARSLGLRAEFQVTGSKELGKVR